MLASNVFRRLVDRLARAVLSRRDRPRRRHFVASRLLAAVQQLEPRMLLSGGTLITLDPPGSVNTFVWAIDGNNVLGSTTAENGAYFIYNGSTYTYEPVGSGINLSNSPDAISGSGAVGWLRTFDPTAPSGSEFGSAGILWNGSTSTELDVPGSSTSSNGTSRTTRAEAISGANIVGTYVTAASDPNVDDPVHGFLYNGSTYTTLDPAGSVLTHPVAISGSNVVGNYSTADNIIRGFLYSGSTYTTLDVPGATATWPVAVSGSTVVGVFSDSSGLFGHSFLFNGSGYTILAVPGSIQTTVSDVSGANVVGVYTDSNHVEHAFIYDGATYTTLDVPGVVEHGVGAQVVVSGQNVAGTYVDASSHAHGFLYRIGNVLTLTKATTVDAQSIEVSYTLPQDDTTVPLRFDVYRSAGKVYDSSAQFIGTQTLDPASDPADLAQGSHTDVALLTGTSLPPNQSLPYIVVVADPLNALTADPNAVKTTYFRTWLLGVVSHGFLPPIPGVTATPAWETSMADALGRSGPAVSPDKYNDVIAFNWVATSGIPVPGQAVAAGNQLYFQVIAKADALAASHPGDVVDLHFIGHSRGTVVISVALQKLMGTTDPALKGSYIRATLLDPHPANAATISLADAFPTTAAIVLPPYVAAELAQKDPQVDIPANVKVVDAYYQHSAFRDFVFSDRAEFVLNVWGEGPSAGITSAVPITWTPLTNVVDQSVGPEGKIIGAIGHSEVHDWYQVHIVNTGLAFFPPANNLGHLLVPASTASATFGPSNGATIEPAASAKGSAAVNLNGAIAGGPQNESSRGAVRSHLTNRRNPALQIGTRISLAQLASNT
jgi:hypothetical protein